MKGTDTTHAGPIPNQNSTSENSGKGIGDIRDESLRRLPIYKKKKKKRER